MVPLNEIEKINQPRLFPEGLIASPFGLVEILHGEEEYWHEIRFAAQQACAALRHGENGRYFFDPHPEISYLEKGRVDFFKRLVTNPRGAEVHLSRLFGEDQLVIAYGIIRRIVSGLGNLVSGKEECPTDRFALALGVIDRALGEIAKNLLKPRL